MNCQLNGKINDKSIEFKSVLHDNNCWWKLHDIGKIITRIEHLLLSSYQQL